MKNRNIIFKLTAFILIIISSSCEDFLDKPIEGQVPTSDIDYTDESRMHEPVAGAYAIGTNLTFNHWAYHFVLDFRSDFIFRGLSVAQPVQEEDIEKYRYEALKSSWILNNWWLSLYGGIRDLNAALEELNKFEEYATNQNLLNQYKAEVRWIRALVYFELARAFGDIPWYDKDIVASELKKSPRSEIYQFIISEMEECVNLLSDQHPNQMERKGAVTKWAAYALLSKAAADIQDYDLMLSASKAIYDSGLFSLYPDYYYLFKKQGELSDENIFEIQLTDFGRESGDATYDAIYWGSIGIAQIGGTKFDGTPFTNGWGYTTPAQKYIDFMESRGEGIRLETSIIYPNTKTKDGDSIGHIPPSIKAFIDYTKADGPGAAEAYWFKAYLPFNQQTEGRYAPGGKNNIRILRYADALLLYAEALVHTGGPGAGDAPLNIVRARAGMSPLSGATIDDILDERAAELEYEWGADRFYDLVRLDRTQELGSDFEKGKDEFYPTPTAQEDLQPGLAGPPVSGLIPGI